MEFITDIITPAQLTGTVQAVTVGGMPFAGVPPVDGPPRPVFGADVTADALLPTLFPVQETDDIEYELESDVSGYGEVARYRSWDAVPQIGKRPGITIIGGEIVPLGWSYRLNEKDLKRFGRLRQALAERGDERVVDQMTKDGINAAGAVMNRLTLAHADIMNTGSMTLTELGNPEAGNALVATFPVPANQIATASTLWSDHANGDAVTTLKAWEAIGRRNNQGRNFDAWLVSTEVAADLQLQAKLIAKAVWNGAPNTVGFPGIDQVNQILRVFGVKAPIVVVDVESPALDRDSTVGSVLGTRKCLGVRAGMGRTLFSEPASVAFLPEKGRIEGKYAAGIIAYAQSSIRPTQVITTAEALAVPALSNPSALFIGTV